MKPRIIRWLALLALVAAPGLATAQSDTANTTDETQTQTRMQSDEREDAFTVDDARDELEAIRDDLDDLLERLDGLEPEAEASAEGAAMDELGRQVSALNRQLRASALQNARQALSRVDERVRAGGDAEAAQRELEGIRRDVEAAYSAGRADVQQRGSDVSGAIRAYRESLGEGDSERFEERYAAVLDALDAASEGERSEGEMSGVRRDLRALEGRVASGDDPEALAQDVERIRQRLQRAGGDENAPNADAVAELDRTLGELTQQLREGRAEAYEHTYGEAAEQADRLDPDRTIGESADYIPPTSSQTMQAIANEAAGDLEALREGVEAGDDPEGLAEEVERIRDELRAGSEQAGSDAAAELDLTLGRLTQELIDGRADAYRDTYGQAVQQVEDLVTRSAEGANGQSDGQTDGQSDGQNDGQTDGQNDGQNDGGSDTSDDANN